MFGEIDVCIDLQTYVWIQGQNGTGITGGREIVHPCIKTIRDWYCLTCCPLFLQMFSISTVCGENLGKLDSQTWVRGLLGWFHVIPQRNSCILIYVCLFLGGKMFCPDCNLDGLSSLPRHKFKLKALSRPGRSKSSMAVSCRMLKKPEKSLVFLWAKLEVETPWLIFSESRNSLRWHHK